MSTVLRIARSQIRDVARSRWLLLYTLFFFAASEGLLQFSGGEAKALASLASLVVLVIPLATIVFGTVYVYTARDFVELVLAQPVRRRELLLGLYLALVLPPVVGFIGGTALPFALHGLATGGAAPALAMLLAVGSALTAVFSGLALVIALHTDDRLRGLGLAIAAWLVLAVVYDGLVLLSVTLLAGHALERPMIALMVANPIDLGRVALLLELDAAALMGYTGAALRHVLGTAAGIALAGAALAAWVAGPAILALRQFQRKDF
jgi:Cu-processing system permease protein